MATFNRDLLRVFAILILVAALALTGTYTSRSQASAAADVRVVNITAQPVQTAARGEQWSGAVVDDGFVYYQDKQGAVCRPASVEEARAMTERDPNVQLQVIHPSGVSVQDAGAGDITIVLRGTAQLDHFPQAKQAFLRAADTWKSLIQAHAPITIVIDVDFGPTRFGEPFPSDVQGSTLSQKLFFPNGYRSVRDSLILRADNSQEAALYNALPVARVPTDLGSTAEPVVPSALLRALGVIAAVADPASETAQFGDPPSIAFNSNFAFDFDPSDGIDADKADFDAVAVHEIGHALGFTSEVGESELDPSASLGLSVLDMFRFRPGTTMNNFMGAQRILSSGGSQVFFAGASDIPLSTGGQDYKPSHWKDKSGGAAVGIMAPVLPNGERRTISDNDLLTFNTFGYLLRSDGSGGGDAPAINSLSASLQGDVLTLTGTATDTQGDITQAQLTLLNRLGSVVAQVSPAPVDFGSQTSVNFELQVSGLGSVPAATNGSLVFIDSRGNRSAAVNADFSGADPGGPHINNAFYAGKLVIKGGGFVGQLQIEINGVIVALKDNESNKKIKIGGSAAALNIRSGDNRVRVINNNLRSDLFVAPLL